MSKKIFTLLMSLIMVLSLTACDMSFIEFKKDDKETIADSDSSVQQSDEHLEGEWAEDCTLDKLRKTYDDKLSKVENLTKELDMQYKKDEVINSEESSYVTDKSIYFNNEKAENNKIENMYFGLKIYGEDLNSGNISLKLILKIDKDEILKNKDFDFGTTTCSKYIEAFTGEANRNYSDINKQIMSNLELGQNEGKIEGVVNGLKEEIIVSKECIFYRLYTKKYKFSDAEMSME